MAHTGTPLSPVETQTPAAAGRTRTLPKAFSAFKHRNYRLWFGGQLISVAGTWMQNIALSWLVYEITQSEFMLGVVGFAGAIPILVVSPWGGLLADLIPKRRLLVITQTCAMLLAFMLSLLVFTGEVQVWHILVVAVTAGLINSFDAPARQSLVVELVSREDLTNAIAMNSVMFNGARVIGPAAGGLILAALGAGWCFLINGLTFLAVIAGLLMMRVPSRPGAVRSRRPLGQLAEGVRYAASRREIIGILMLASIFGFFGMAYSSQLPAYVDQVFHTDATGYGLISAVVGLGAICGAFVVAQYHDRLPRGRVLFFAEMAYAVLLLVFALNANFSLALVMAFGLGICFMLQLNTLNSTLQLIVSDEMRGRVLSLYTITLFGLSPFGNLLVGTLAEHWSLTGTVALAAVVTGGLSLLVFLRLPELRRL